MRFTIGALLLALPLGAAAQQPATATVCARLAPQLGLKQQPARGGEPAMWRAGMFGVGAALFGGTAGVSFAVQPIEGSTADQDFGNACKQAKADITCRVAGPARIVIGTKKGEAATDVAAGERAEVGTNGRNIICREV